MNPDDGIERIHQAIYDAANELTHHPELGKLGVGGSWDTKLLVASYAGRYLDNLSIQTIAGKPVYLSESRQAAIRAILLKHFQAHGVPMFTFKHELGPVGLSPSGSKRVKSITWEYKRSI